MHQEVILWQPCGPVVPGGHLGVGLEQRLVLLGGWGLLEHDISHITLISPSVNPLYKSL